MPVISKEICVNDPSMLAEVNQLAQKMKDCFDANVNQRKRDNPNYQPLKSSDNKTIIDDKYCYDTYSVLKGNVKCAKLPDDLGALGYALTDEFLKDTTKNPAIRALKTTEAQVSNDWFVGVM